MSDKPLLRRRATLIPFLAECERNRLPAYSGGGAGKWRKKTTLPLAKVTPLEG
jgi:hypothetical protein